MPRPIGVGNREMENGAVGYLLILVASMDELKVSESGRASSEETFPSCQMGQRKGNAKENAKLPQFVAKTKKVFHSEKGREMQQS